MADSTLSDVSVTEDRVRFTIEIKPAEGKVRTFLVDESTKFVGPKGGSRGMGKAGLKDDTMVSGNEVRVVPGPGDKMALEVHLPTRKSDGKPFTVAPSSSSIGRSGPTGSYS